MRRVAPAFLVSVLVLSVSCGPPSDHTVDEGGGNPNDPQNPCLGDLCVNFCPTGTRTSISGVVTAPNGIDPIPSALVYVPRAFEEFPQEVGCEICGDILSNAFVLTKTEADGSFTLSPVPTRQDAQPGDTVPVVVQKGRFRKVLALPIEAPCEANAIADGVFRLPGKNDGMDTIPRIAVATGDYDSMECVLMRFGLEVGSFDLFEGSAFGGLGGTSTLPGFDGLLRDLPRMKGYNIIFINCTNDTFEDMLNDPAIRQNVRDYVGSGGRLYVTDWSYDWIEQVEEFSGVIDYEPGASDMAPEPHNAATLGAGEEVAQANVLDQNMQDWMRAVEVRAGEETISDANTVTVQHFLGGWVLQLATAISEQTRVWITANIDGMNDRPLTTTYDYNACGRWLYSSYHTAGKGDEFDPFGGGLGLDFPGYCGSGGLSPQERVLEYLILHVADCVQVD